MWFEGRRLLPSYGTLGEIRTEQGSSTSMFIFEFPPQDKLEQQLLYTIEGNSKLFLLSPIHFK